MPNQEIYGYIKGGEVEDRFDEIENSFTKCWGITTNEKGEDSNITGVAIYKPGPPSFDPDAKWNLKDYIGIVTTRDGLVFFSRLDYDGEIRKMTGHGLCQFRAKSNNYTRCRGIQVCGKTLVLPLNNEDKSKSRILFYDLSSVKFNNCQNPERLSDYTFGVGENVRGACLTKFKRNDTPILLLALYRSDKVKLYSKVGQNIDSNSDKFEAMTGWEKLEKEIRGGGLITDRRGSVYFIALKGGDSEGNKNKASLYKIVTGSDPDDPSEGWVVEKIEHIKTKQFKRKEEYSFYNSGGVFLPNDHEIVLLNSKVKVSANTEWPTKSKIGMGKFG